LRDSSVVGDDYKYDSLPITSVDIPLQDECDYEGVMIDEYFFVGRSYCSFRGLQSLADLWVSLNRTPLKMTSVERREQNMGASREWVGRATWEVDYERECWEPLRNR
jgi:hypothetical protein